MTAILQDAGTAMGRPAPGGKPRRPKGTILGVDASSFWLMLPTLLPVLLFSVYPLAYGIYLGFTDARPGGEIPFTGLENVKAMFKDGYFWQSFRVGAIWSISSTVLQFVFSLGLALLLNANLRFRSLTRTMALIPWAMPPVVIAFMWKLLYHPDAGVLNDVLQSLGLLHGSYDWLASNWALAAVIVVAVWGGMPQTTIVLLAGLQGVPSELHEAAALDGAGGWMRFQTVTWPAIKPVVVAITTLDFIWAFNQFGLVYILTGGGPGGSTRLPMLFAYEEAFQYGNFGYAAALGNAMVLIIAALVVLYLRQLSRDKSEA